VECDLALPDAALLTLSSEAQIVCRMLPGRGPWKGVVQAMEPNGLGLLQRMRVRVRVPTPQQDLPPGALVEAKFSVPLSEVEPFHSLASHSPGTVLAVPESAVIDTGEHQVVYVETGPGMFDGVAVKLGPTADGFVSVLSGLEAGQRVAAAGAFLLDAETRLNPHLAAAYFGAASGEATNSVPAKRGPLSVKPKSKQAKPEKDYLADLDLPPADRKLAQRQRVCPVTKLPLGSMGAPVRVEWQGRVVFLCCEGCRAKFEKDQAAAAENQSPSKPK
jgi:hypothetical protein